MTRQVIFLLAMIILFVVSPWATQPAFAQDFEINIGWIYYKDNSDREIFYDFSTGVMDDYGIVDITSGVLTVPPSEVDSTFLWEPGFGEQEVTLADGIYKMSVPQAVETVKDIPTANIAVDGWVEDWDDVSTYMEDKVGDVSPWWPPGASADVNYVKLAYSPDYSKLYILTKLEAPANSNVWYRFFLDKNLNSGVGEPGDYQIDIQYNGIFWDVVSQGWNSRDGWDWYPVEENGVVSVSGEFIEASVDSAAFDLPESVNIYGRTMQHVAPYTTYDRFSNHFLETSGFSAMGGGNVAAPFPSEWQFTARISGFRNPGFGNLSPHLHWYAVSVGAGSSEPNDMEPSIEACWVTGTYEGVNYENALFIGAEIENDLPGENEYEWGWYFGESGGVVLTGLDPNTTVLDLKVDVNDSGQSVSFYYRIDSNEVIDWQLAVTHNLPPDTGTIYGFYDVFPTVDMSTGFEVNACDLNNDGLVNFSDFSVLALAWLSERGRDRWNPACDVSEIADGIIDHLDLAIFVDNWLWGE